MNIAEIFESIHGECNGHHQGRIVTFIRLSGCNLSCSYCDTPKTQDPKYGTNMDIFEVHQQVKKFGHKYICITGGEPLINPSIFNLLRYLWMNGYKISVETNGTIDIAPFTRYVESFVIDYKLECFDKMFELNYLYLCQKDVIKFVVKNEDDLLSAISVKNKMESKGTGAIFAFSPMHPNLSGQQLVELLMNHKVYNSVLSLQIHKILRLP